MTKKSFDAAGFTDFKALLCFSHLRWNFVWQRPQHLMVRFAKQLPVYYFEEPMYEDIEKPFLDLTNTGNNVTVLVPKIPNDRNEEAQQIQKELIESFIEENAITDYIAWYYTPMALGFTPGIKPSLTVYDCMDELSAFKFAPPELRENEQRLLQKADVVFTGGYSIYEAKKDVHRNIHPMPSSIDKDHFAKARTVTEQPEDQAGIAHPRFGFAGVIDERFDIELIRDAAAQKPDWQFVIIGPVVKIDEAVLPRFENIHYLGSKNYNELPQYMAGWDVAMIPFALNESTKYISPTKTPEYLAAGKPVISTAITDVINPYREHDLVYIINDAKTFIQAGTDALQNHSEKEIQKADYFMRNMSWDNTWMQMRNIIENTAQGNNNNINDTKKEQVYV